MNNYKTILLGAVAYDPKVVTIWEEKEKMSHINAADTLREWRESAPFWEKHRDTIRTMLAPLTQALIEEAGIVPGQSVLDVAGLNC